MMASFQAPAAGLDHHLDMPPVPEPESLPSLAEVLANEDHPMAQRWLRQRHVDLRHVEGPLYLRPGADPVPQQAVWLRCLSPLTDDPAVHAAVLAYASDFSLLEPVLRRHRLSWSVPGMKVASLDHAMWWHRPARADEWLLYVQRSPSASGARGLAFGEIFTREGALACSVAQEGMVRLSQS